MIVRLPDCPTCAQPFTSVYLKRLACTRCGTVGAIARPDETPRVAANT